MLARWSKTGLWKVKRGGDTVHGINPAPPEIHQTLMENGKLLPTPTNGERRIFSINSMGLVLLVVAFFPGLPLQ